MRIIAGVFRGRRLNGPHGRNIRPTADRVREAIFSIIAAHLPHARVLDAFAGTGALGLEALSRGAAWAVFIDQSAAAVRLIRSNIAACGVQDRTHVIQKPIQQALRILAIELLGPLPFHVVFLDPPYGRGQLVNVLGSMLELGIVGPGTLAVAEHHKRESFPSAWSGWQLTKQRSYGDTTISLFSCVGADEQHSALEAESNI
jgi:16S rRNA (guanine(966)-N(2))-methyltransferase RsmD